MSLPVIVRFPMCKSISPISLPLLKIIGFFIADAEEKVHFWS